MDRRDWGEDDAEPTRPPLPPEDRVWRHPSELGNPLVTPTALGPAAAATGSRGPVVLVAVAAGVLLLVAAGVSVRVLTDRTPSFAAADTVGSTVSLVATPAAVTTSATDHWAGTNVKVEATHSKGVRTSNAVVVDGSTLVTTITAVAGAHQLSALLPDGRRLGARLLGKDPRSGVAVVGVSGRLDRATTGSAVDLRVGQRVWTAGEGAGTIEALGRSTTSPYGSRLRHVMKLGLDKVKVREGTALMDSDGTVIGLCTRDATGEVVGIPIDLATSAARSLRANESSLVLPWIGVIGSDVSPDRREGVPHGGALLTSLDKGGPAEAAGLLPGDVVVELGSTEVRSISAFILAARAYQPGQTVPVTVVRDGQEVEIPLTLGRLP